MAYLNLVEYDEGGRIQSLDGLDAVTYDDGAKRNLLGANLHAVKYDDGGRFRTLVGMGQDPSLDIPIDLPLTPPGNFIPIEYMPPTPSPIVDTVSAPVTGTLVSPSGPQTPPIFYAPTPIVDTVPTPMKGTLVDTTQVPVPPSVQSPTAGVLTSIFSGIRNIFASGGSAALPPSAGKLVNTVGPSGLVSSSWFSQAGAFGLPNWGMLVGAGVVGLVFVSSLKGGGGSRRNPGRRRNPAELILMGANPSRRRRVR
jgi:hypothetical protein